MIIQIEIEGKNIIEKIRKENFFKKNKKLMFNVNRIRE